ncbi:sugar transferase [Flagellimonas lutaonensis]|uniref:Exopolysaccharide production protein n=1 Tax=Flagellimonas lutaonensis TaxID=516051 RepID=A0A0D5YRT2_9FLAO|nr:sugar transferase [Allomuricauda lutaonensis]AKA34992.1 Exopolysaccharide production protein [Allomuricauda lutaonensis]
MPRPSILNSIERKFILLVGDLLIISASLNLLINHAIDKEFVSTTLKVFVFAFGILVFLGLSYILDFYNLEKVAKRRYIVSLSIFIAAFYVFLVFIFAVFFFDVSFWRIPLLSFLLLTPIEVGLWRLFFGNMFRIIPTTKNVLYIYDKFSADSVKNETNAINGYDINTFYKVRLTYSIDHNTLVNKSFFLSAAEKIDTIIVNIKDYERLTKDLENMIVSSILNGKEVISYMSFYESTYEALPLTSHNESYYEILQLRNRKIRYLQTIFTFCINFVLSVFVGTIFLLVTPFVWFCNLFFNRGPLFYTQKRVGKYGKEFKIYKFRSMVVDAEKSGAKMASKNDMRVTPFGKVLRMFRIDEIPQIISVIKGNMQFIGPRPERKIFVDELNQITPFYNVRHIIKPGITGWAQVKFKYGENLDDSIKKLEYDLYYIKNRSITLDLRIIFKTITTVLFSRGV